MNPKWMVAGVVLVFAVTSALAFYFRAEAPKAAPAPPAPVAAKPPAPPKAVAPPPPPVEGAVEGAPEPLMEAVAPVDPLAGLWGWWNAEISTNENHSESHPANFQKDNAGILLSVEYIGLPKLRGTWINQQLRLVALPNSEMQLELNGPYDGAQEPIVLSGSVSMKDADPNVAETSMKVKVTLTRIPQEQGSLMEVSRARIAEVKAMHDAMEKYKEVYGKYPKFLKEAALYFPLGGALLESSTGRTLEYHPYTQGAPNISLTPPKFNGDDAEFSAQMKAHEEAMKNILKDYFFRQPDIRVTYDDPPQTVSSRSGNVRSEAPTPGDEARVRAECQNHLKQLGLVNKMFQNECANQHYIPGFFSVYPEYMSDPNILSCPAQPTGHDSYVMVYPFTTDAEVYALYEQITGKPVDLQNNQVEASIAQSTVPIVFERETHTTENGGTGRNVLFFDGHVEFISSENWNQRIGPYLR